MKVILKAALVSLLSLITASCGIFGRTEPPVSEETPAIAAEQPAPQPDAVESQKEQRPITKIEVVWAASEEKVDGFILKYGEAPERMENEIKIPVSELIRTEEPGHGSVFKYYIPDTYPGKTIYVSLAAFNGDNVSHATVPVKVEP